MSKKRPEKSEARTTPRTTLRRALADGRIEGHPDGHGFLVPDDGAPSIYLAAAEMRQVLHGDRASARVIGSDSRGRPSGEIVKVLERVQHRIVGRLHARRGVLFLAPEDRRIAQDIVVPPANAGRAKAGQVVTVELISQPSKHAQPVGRVVEVLGNFADPGLEIEIALRKFDLPHEFSKRALALARSMPDEVREDEGLRRRGARGSRRQGLQAARRDRRRQPLRAAWRRAGSRCARTRYLGLLSAPRAADAAREALQRPLLAQPGRRSPGDGLRHGDRHARQGRAL